jgi:hypothetical protein
METADKLCAGLGRSLSLGCCRLLLASRIWLHLQDLGAISLALIEDFTPSSAFRKFT